MRKTPRLFLESDSFRETRVKLEQKEEHYLKNVLRLRTGDEFIALDGQGIAWTCAIEGDGWAYKRDDFSASDPHPLELCVGLALCKGSRFENAIEKLAELGVRELIPLETDRTERKRPSQSKLERWAEIALSASALAYRRIPLSITSPRLISDVLQQSQDELCFCHPGGATAATYFAAHRESLTILVGPEGGFSPAEVKALESRAVKVDLGSYNLRVETAATVSSGLALNLHGFRKPKECDSPTST